MKTDVDVDRMDRWRDRAVHRLHSKTSLVSAVVFCNEDLGRIVAID